MITMYPGMVNSPKALLSAAIAADATSLVVDDGAKLPAAPNLAVLGVGDDAETILYTVKSGNVISGISRAVQGVAKVWPENTILARNFTEKDYAAILANLLLLFPADETVGLPLFWGVDGVETKTPAAARVALSIPWAAMSDTTLYVSASGSDSTGDGTAGNPFATPGKAASMVPYILNAKNVEMIVGSGIFPGFSMSGRMGGRLTITGAGVGVTIFSSPIVIGSSSNFRVGGFSISDTTVTDTGLLTAVDGARLKVISSITLTGGNGATSRGVFVRDSLMSGEYAAMITVNNCTYGMQTLSGDIRHDGVLAGSGCSVGVSSINGVAIIRSRSISATTAIQEYDGGKVF